MDKDYKKQQKKNNKENKIHSFINNNYYCCYTQEEIMIITHPLIYIFFNCFFIFILLRWKSNRRRAPPSSSPPPINQKHPHFFQAKLSLGLFGMFPHVLLFLFLFFLTFLALEETMPIFQAWKGLDLYHDFCYTPYFIFLYISMDSK